VTRATVTVKVPAEAGHLALLRTAVGGFAARQQLTLDQVDDLRMAVEEVAVQLLRQAGDERLTMDISSLDEGVEVRLHAPVAQGAAVIEETSWSWMILKALADDIRVDREAAHATVILVKHRLAGLDDEGAA
jgi:serine/threonine-protein kinase RsbW